MERRTFLGAAAGVAGRRRARRRRSPQGAAARTLRVIPQANLTSLDPVWTTAVVTRNHAFLIYDQLCAQDAKGEVRPQMAEGWDTSAGRSDLGLHPARGAEIPRWRAGAGGGLRRLDRALGGARHLQPGAVGAGRRSSRRSTTGASASA